MTQVFIADTGTDIILDCGVDISSATVRKIFARKPNGITVEWTAVADGTSAIKYKTLVADLDIAGTWQLQSYIEMPGWKGKGNIAQLIVSSGL